MAVLFTCHCLIYQQDESCSSCDFRTGTLFITDSALNHRFFSTKFKICTHLDVYVRDLLPAQ